MVLGGDWVGKGGAQEETVKTRSPENLLFQRVTGAGRLGLGSKKVLFPGWPTLKMRDEKAWLEAEKM